MTIIDNTLLKYVGIATLLYYSHRIFFFIKRLHNESLSSQTFNFKKFGSWAVVTGASDGIGRAISVELAKYGMNLVLISRTKSKLEKLATHLQENYKIKAKYIAVDFSEESVYDIIEEETKGLDIALLLNNVGMALPDMGYFLNAPNIAKFNVDICRVNVLAMTKMTQLVLPQMVKRGGGVITNVSTIATQRDFPFFSLYCATKHALENFTYSLKREYGSKGVIMQCLAPAVTATSMPNVKPSFWVPSAERYARYAIKSLGKSTYTNTNLFPHNLTGFIVPLFPNKFFASMMRAESEKALSKKKEEEKVDGRTGTK